jgi:hypothetical protein
MDVVELAPHMSPTCGFDDPAGFVEMMESSIGIGLQNPGEEAQMLFGRGADKAICLYGEKRTLTLLSG